MQTMNISLRDPLKQFVDGEESELTHQDFEISARNPARSWKLEKTGLMAAAVC